MTDNVFSTSFLLYNSTKGFCLHKVKKNNISSTFKFKSKVHQARYSKQSTLPYFKQKEDIITQQLHLNAKERLSECRKFRSLHLDSTGYQQKQQIKNEISTESNTNRCDKNRISSVTFEPCFPEIDRKKSKTTSKSFRSIEGNKLQHPQDNMASDRLLPQKISRTLEPNHLSQVKQQIEQLITKQVLKTENQVVLKQGKIKFDESQAKMIIQVRKKPNNATKKKKKSKQYLDQYSSHKEQNANARAALQGSAIKSFSPMKATKIKFETVFAKQRRYSNEANLTNFKNKHLKKISDSSQHHGKGTGVIGWQNQNLSDSSEVFDLKQRDTEIQSKEMRNPRSQKI